MTPEQRKKLEKMAEGYAISMRQYGVPEVWVQDFYLAGAQAAWEMATQAERQRCAELVSRNSGDRYWLENQILNPEKAGGE